MKKLKTKKTLAKRIRITRTGKVMVGQSGVGHLKVKWDSSRRNRKKKSLSQQNKGHAKVLKKLMHVRTR